METLISPRELLSNLNNALIGIIQLDFEVNDITTGIVTTRLNDSLCHFSGKCIKDVY